MSQLADELSILAVLVLSGAVVFRLRRLAARPHDPAERAHLGIYALAALALALTVGPVYAAFDRLLGWPNAALLASALLAFASAWCVQLFYLFVTQPSADLRVEMARRVALLAAGCLLEAALFLLANPHEEVAGVPAFRDRYGQQPAILALSAVIYGWSALVFWTIAQLSRHYAALSRRPMSRLGLYVTVCGALLGVVGAIHNELALVFRSLGWRYPFDPPDAPGHALRVGAVVLLVTGTTMPRWGRRLGIAAALRWLADYRAYVDLQPLWRDLCRAAPEVALGMPARAGPLDLLPPRGLRFHLYRRLIEILDARLVLRPYIDAFALELAAELRQRRWPARPAPGPSAPVAPRPNSSARGRSGSTSACRRPASPNGCAPRRAARASTSSWTWSADRIWRTIWPRSRSAAESWCSPRWAAATRRCPWVC